MQLCLALQSSHCRHRFTSLPAVGTGATYFGQRGEAWGPEERRGGAKGWRSKPTRAGARRVGGKKRGAEGVGAQTAEKGWEPEGWGPEGWGPKSRKKVRARRVGARRVGCSKGGGPEGWPAQNFALFFSSPTPIFILFFSLWGSSRGILVVFWSVGPSNVLVFALRLSCGSPPAGPFHGPNRPSKGKIGLARRKSAQLSQVEGCGPSWLAWPKSAWPKSACVAKVGLAKVSHGQSRSFQSRPGQRRPQPLALLFCLRLALLFLH